MDNSKESAFPLDIVKGDSNYTAYGLTKRELLAAMALQSMITRWKLDKHGELDLKSISKAAVSAADALIKELG